MRAQNADSVWFAAYHDWSGCAVFATEAEALRFGNDHGGMLVAEIRYGEMVGPGWAPSGAQIDRSEADRG